MTTKTTRVMKKTHPANLAAPVLNAAFRHDAQEMDRVIGCIERKSVFCPAPEYLFTREFLEGRLLMLGLEFWRSTAFASNVNAAILADPQRPARELVGLDDEFQAWKGWARMLDRLLTGMCSVAGLDEPATRAFLSLPDADEAPLTVEEQADLAERLDEFRAALAEAGRGI